MEIKSAADVATVRARSEWFTGPVWQDPLLEAPEPARVEMVAGPSNRAPALRGTLTLLVKRCTCCQA